MHTRPGDLFALARASFVDLQGIAGFQNERLLRPNASGAVQEPRGEIAAGIRHGRARSISDAPVEDRTLFGIPVARNVNQGGVMLP
jgi:hypothetical protein